MARLRQGRANTARGAAHFLRETVGRVRYAGATGPLTMRADSGFYTHDIVAACRAQSVRYSITVRQHQSVRNIIEAIPEAEWTPIPYWMEGAADVAETEYTPFGSKPDAAPVRLIVRRVKPTPGSPLTNVVTRRLGRREVCAWCGPRRRTWAPVGSPVGPPAVWPRARPAADTVSRSVRRQHPRTPGHSAAWCR